MADIGIDLGTATTLIYRPKKGIVLNEPTVVAYNKKTKKNIAFGKEAYNMIGRAPDNIQIIAPLKDGVISDFYITEQMISYFLNKVVKNILLKPRIAVCVPSGSTSVESRAVVEVIELSGVRKVALIEEPVAAALGSGLDLTIPRGRMIVDIGGGTIDVAVLSLNGVASRASRKIAGKKFDEALIKYLKQKHNLIIGDRTAENVKMFLGNVYKPDKNIKADVKGKDSITGYPKIVTINEYETFLAFSEVLKGVVDTFREAFENTLPELISDIYEDGVTMTGGGSLLKGLPKYLEQNLKVGFQLSKNPIEAVAIGTGMTFEFLGTLEDGINIK